MDIISHGLWGGLVLGGKKRIEFILALVFSILPDIFAEGVMFFLVILGLNGMPSLENGHPNIVDFPVYAQNFYNTTHSLFVFLIVFAIVWMLIKKPFWPLAGWGMHILIDIPTHSLELFPTPFLWPISDYRFDGVGWDNPIIMIPNIALLLFFYGTWIYRRRIKANL